jgi:hypothetical protein
MRRTRTIVLALALAASLVPAASASGGPFKYPSAPAERADHSGVTVAVVFAGACLLLGALTVLPRRPRKGA